MLILLKESRDFCLAALRKMPGVTVPVPDGAFYVFPENRRGRLLRFVQALMETQVGLAPGVAFGTGGEGSVRICYATERPILEEAMARLSRLLNAR
jgi:aspartate/methionine/tyrosine aminotransferase